MQAWAGFVESRLRKLVSDLLSRSLPLKKIQLWPKKMQACIVDKTALLTQGQRENCLTYFIGFQVDEKRMRGDQLNVEIPLQNFREWDLSRFPVLVSGMDILVKHFRVKELPKLCFEGMYENGKEEAMKKRRQLRDTDPVRQEKKKLAKLEILKAKMEAIQRRKEEQKKRKRDEVDLEEEALKDEAKQEELISVSCVAPEESKDGDEEADLLLNALETAQESGGMKTREEVEAERKKLLAGELIEEDEEPDEVGYESDENAVGYAKDEVRQVLVKKSKEDETWRDKRSLPVSDNLIKALCDHGYNIVSDEEAIQLGSNMVSSWQNVSEQERLLSFVNINFTETFPIAKLDANGHVIDKGDNDFIPSKKWIGRKPAMEFKLGGQYR